MALIQQEAAKVVEDVCRQSLTNRGYSAAPTQEIHLEVDTLTIEEIAEATVMPEAAVSGCRFLISYADGERVFAEMTTPDTYGAATFKGLSKGPLCNLAWDLIHQAQVIPEVAAMDFDLRLLSVPSLQVQALRLKSRAEPSLDLFFPILKTGEDSGNKMYYTAEEYLAILRPLATRRLKFSESNFI